MEWWLFPVAGLVMAVLVVITLPYRQEVGAAAPVGFPQVQQIVQARCQVCHSATPHYPGIGEAPKGVKFDTPAEIAAHAPQIYTQAVASKAMPLSNLTGITDEERRALGLWVTSGSRIQ